MKILSHELIYEMNFSFFDDPVQARTSKPVLVQLQCIAINNSSNNSAC